ncbi:MAG TPA: hypothetical protein VGA40_01335 [Candidatus Acidoferrales bacterium]
MKVRSTMFCLWMAAMLLVSPAFLLAQGKGGKEPSRTAGDKVRDTLPPAERIFTVEERTVVKNWFRTNTSNLPPGLAKRDRLPPGLERQLRKNGSLPPGLQKKVHPLPGELERRLRVLPTGYRRVVLGNTVILMNEKTALIYDIVRNAIP